MKLRMKTGSEEQSIKEYRHPLLFFLGASRTFLKSIGVSNIQHSVVICDLQHLNP